jgi:AraC family transcriptional regulator of arabinose operon
VATSDKIVSTVPPVRFLGMGSMLGQTIRHTVRTEGSRDWLLIYTVAGSGLYRFKGGEYASRPHDVTLYRPGAFQDYQWSPKTRRWDLLFAHFMPRDEWLPWLNWPLQGEGLMLLHLKEPAIWRRVGDRLRKAVLVTQGSQPRRHLLGLNALEEALLWCDSVNPRQASSDIDPRVRKVMESICQDSAAPFAEERWARSVGLSGSRLRHLFGRQVGKSIRDFQEEQRLEKAGQLLAHSSLTIAEIADNVGFFSPFYFSLRFKKKTGENPRGFRRRLQEENRQPLTRA